jgi:hypothetical protein
LIFWRRCWRSKEINMTTLQARSWARAVGRPTKSRNHDRIRTFARDALAIAVLAAIFAACIALRVLMFVHLP